MHMNRKSFAYSEQAVSVAEPLNAASITVAQEEPGVVDSLLHPLAILIRQVLTRPGRIERNLILIDDEENIMQALEAGVEIHSIYYSGDEVLSPQLIRKLPSGMSVHEIARRTCKKLFENDKMSRVFAIAHTPAPRRFDSLLQTPHDIVALEDLTISGNIGAIIRTSLAFGAGAIVLLNAQSADIYDRRLIRASRGHVFSLPIVAATTEGFIQFCQQHQIPILVTAVQADYAVQKAASLAGRLMIVFGSEKDGCSEMLVNAATLHVQIPTDSKVESLNVSTAAGIMLYSRAWFNLSQVRK
ncbi:MAG TPA: TrmH family RNA methyltransferase [Anaerolineales bacterium]|nr:TrmH family RNA methyltransferase [Anaerolineales bacterium]